MTKVAILGLGAMGVRMANNLLGAGHEVVVYNRTAERAQPLVDAGATRADTPRDAAAGADIAIGMVTDDAASRAIWLGDDGAVAGLRAGAVAIESSTLTPDWARELAEAVAAREADFLDAPVAGSRPQAEAGALVYLVGGDAAALDRARGALSAMGGAIHHIGPVGSGMVLKLAVNGLFGVQVAALAELLAMVQKAGVDRDRAIEVVGAMSITSPAVKWVAGLMAARAFEPLFPIDLVEKDFGYIVAAAERAGAEVPTAAAVRAVYARARDAGHGADNISGVIQVFE